MVAEHQEREALDSVPSVDRSEVFVKDAPEGALAKSLTKKKRKYNGRWGT